MISFDARSCTNEWTLSERDTSNFTPSLLASLIRTLGSPNMTKHPPVGYGCVLTANGVLNVLLTEPFIVMSSMQVGLHYTMSDEFHQNSENNENWVRQQGNERDKQRHLDSLHLGKDGSHGIGSERQQRLHALAAVLPLYESRIFPLGLWQPFTKESTKDSSKSILKQPSAVARFDGPFYSSEYEANTHLTSYHKGTTSAVERKFLDDSYERLNTSIGYGTVLAPIQTLVMKTNSDKNRSNRTSSDGSNSLKSRVSFISPLFSINLDQPDMTGDSKSMLLSISIFQAESDVIPLLDTFESVW